MNSEAALIGNTQTQQTDTRGVAHITPLHSKHTTLSSNAIKLWRTYTHPGLEADEWLVFRLSLFDADIETQLVAQSLYQSGNTSTFSMI